MRAWSRGTIGILGVVLALSMTGCGAPSATPESDVAASTPGHEEEVTTPTSPGETSTELRIPKESAISCEDFADLAPEVFGGLHLVHSLHKEENETSYGNIECFWSTEPDIKSESEYSIGLNILGNNTPVEHINNLLDINLSDQVLQSDVYESYGGTIRGNLDPENAEKVDGSFKYRIMSFVPILELNLSYSCGGSTSGHCREGQVGLTTETGIAFLENVVR